MNNLFGEERKIKKTYKEKSKESENLPVAYYQKK